MDFIHLVHKRRLAILQIDFRRGQVLIEVTRNHVSTFSVGLNFYLP